MSEANNEHCAAAGLYRLVTRDTEIGGTAVAVGSMVYLCIAAAHFDADAHPERFDPERPPEFRYGARGFVQHGTEAMHVLLS